MAALAARGVSESYGRLICLWTNRLPGKFRDESDELLLAAAASGLGLEELAALAAQMYERARSELPDEDPGRDFADRSLKLATTFGGAGVIHGDLTPECAELAGRVLDALGAKAGKDDDRTRDQRYHDALAEAMRRLVASDLLPERAGQPVKAWAHISLADLLLLDADSALQDQWTAQVRERWAARRAFASETGSEGGAWLDGDAAEGIACDAAMAPIVTGEVNVDALQDLVRLCVELDRLRSGTARGTGGLGRARAGRHRQGRRPLCRARAGWRRSLRRRQLGARLGGPSLPLDIGYAETVPAGIRNAVILRDRKCRWAGGCDQPASACEVHHTKHKADGGKTSTKGLRAAVHLPSPDRDPPAGLDPGPEPRRDDDRVEQGQDEGAAQPRAPGPGRVGAPARRGLGSSRLEPGQGGSGVEPDVRPVRRRADQVRCVGDRVRGRGAWHYDG